MGSEQYCLRWNNHQSNLLGVFSQLLQDESLVDVTLACSEGTSIRAHKVVLSACSSYFQSLFLDHPAKHPIVILKDVRFAELRTLIEFMYKGEVNVEYCQLSALLKTAESLKVKGLAEMTNQSTASKEPERDRDSERLRLHTPTTPSAAPSSSVKNEILELSSKQQRLDNNICSPSPPSRVPSSPGSSLSSIYQKKLLTISASASATTTSITGSSSHHIDSIIKEEPTFNDHRTHHQHRNDESMEDDDDDDENIQMKNEVGLNMTLNSSLLQNSISSSVNSTSSLADMQSSRYSSNLLGNSSNAGGTRQQSPLSSDLPGPSGIGPMQHAPLSLKKEADWDRSDDKESSSSEYRHSHGDMESSTDVHCERSSSVVGLPISSSSSSELNSSVNSNNSGPIFPCMYCGQTFPHQSKLTRHILSHSLETLKYREVSHLLGHTQLGFLPHDLPPPSHFTSRQVSMESLEPSDNSPIDMENPFGNNPGTSNSTNDPNSSGNSGGVVLCKFCGKSFPDVSSLITHLPVHTGDRPFKCEFCGKAFKLRHHMKDHCRVHTGERPFRCQMCGKTFSRSTILKAHEKTHYPKYRDRYQRFMAPKPSSSIMSGLHRLKSSSTPQMSSTATSPSMVPSMMPFHFPFSPFSLGMNLFDMTAANENRNSPSIDPNRILHILHQQSLLAEELLKYRALLGLPSPSTSTSSTSSSSNSSSHPFFNDMKPSIELFKIPNSHDTKFNKDIVHESEMIPSKRQTPSSSTEIDLTKDDGCSTPKIKARPESELLSEKSSTTSTTISPAAVSAMLIDPDELKCHICMANFPSLWLLEQHTALQHSQLSCSEKQNKCEHCGQNYRYNCCLQSTLLMNSQDHPGNPNRARVPADKLFTCDVCGMQFRYLKSFKKHRLNHALERLHGKKEMNENSGELMVSSTNDESGIPKGVISLEDEQMLLDDQDQDDTIDSISNTNSNMNFSSTNLINTKQMNDPNLSISADNNNFGGDIKDKSSISSAITECDKQETNGNITSSDKLLDEMTDMANTQHDAESSSALNFTMSSLQNSFSMQGSSGSLKSLTMTNQSLMGLNSQEASILNFLRVDADKRDKRFACPFCGKCVRSKENLKLHVRKHTGERPFVCLFCGRAFGGKSDLTRHLRIHTGERPYHCESCGKCFARADYLSKHLTTHVHNTQSQQQR